MFDQLTVPFALFFTNTDRIYWLYLLTAFTIAFFLFVVHKQDYANSGIDLMAYVFPKDIILHRASIVFFIPICCFRGLLFAHSHASAWECIRKHGDIQSQYGFPRGSMGTRTNPV
ncbi:hypothetical protein [Methylobacter svalbardensis]|uniref:hypothetical protein n=1 Tax=Methylobacter svalbardensis TaxID=3080016 RepID=UPI0030EDD153